MLIVFGSLELCVDMLPSFDVHYICARMDQHHRVGSTCIRSGGSSAGATETWEREPISCTYGSKEDHLLKAMVGETLMLVSIYGCLLASQSYSTCDPRGSACIFSLSHIESCIEDIEPEILTIRDRAKPPLLPPPFHTRITVYLVYCCITNIYFCVFIFLQSYFSYPCYRSSFIS